MALFALAPTAMVASDQSFEDRPDPRAHFRADIEGLRAVAVIAVLLFHVGLPGVPGGFVGVDVFYVISGFLITGLLVRELTATSRVDLVTFYARRLRRLLPAALVVIGVTLVTSWAVLSRLRFPEVAGDAAASALYVSNIRFAEQATDYLAAHESPSPYLHFWSLAVEEQFYLVWPMLLFVGARLLTVARLGILLGAVAFGSFALSLLWTDTEAPWAFFSLPTRAWELAVGALIAVGVLRLPRRSPQMVAIGLVTAGLALIALACAVIDASTPYPGTAALLPVAGTALVIIGGSATSAGPSRWLSMSVPRWLGRISYSLYLWHWPILVLVPIALGTDSLVLRLGLAAIAVVVAAVSTTVIETPIRRERVLRAGAVRSLAAAGACSVAMAVMAVGAGIIVLTPSSSPVVVAASDEIVAVVTPEPTAPTVVAAPTQAPRASLVAPATVVPDPPTTAPSTATAAPVSVLPPVSVAAPITQVDRDPRPVSVPPVDVGEAAFPRRVATDAGDEVANTGAAGTTAEEPAVDTVTPTTSVDRPTASIDDPVTASRDLTPDASTDVPVVSRDTVAVEAPPTGPSGVRPSTWHHVVTQPPTERRVTEVVAPDRGPDALEVAVPVAPIDDLPPGVLSGPLPKQLQPRLEDARKDLPESYADGCHLVDFGLEKLGDCVYGKRRSDTTAVLIGDSHAAQWLPALVRLADERGWRLLGFTKSGCPMADVKVWNATLKRAYRECDQWRENVIARLGKEDVDIAFVANADMYQVIDEEGHREPPDQQERWRVGLTESLERIGQVSDRVVMLADTPRLAYDPLECLATHGDIAGCDVAIADLLDRDYGALEAEIATDAGVERISANGWICPDTTCPLVRGTLLVFRDDHHLTATFATALAERIGAALDGSLTTP